MFAECPNAASPGEEEWSPRSRCATQYATVPINKSNIRKHGCRRCCSPHCPHEISPSSPCRTPFTHNVRSVSLSSLSDPPLAMLSIQTSVFSLNLFKLLSLFSDVSLFCISLLYLLLILFMLLPARSPSEIL